MGMERVYCCRDCLLQADYWTPLSVADGVRANLPSFGVGIVRINREKQARRCSNKHQLIRAKIVVLCVKHSRPGDGISVM